MKYSELKENYEWITLQTELIFSSLDSKYIWEEV